MTPDELTKRYYHDRGYWITKVESWGLHPSPHRKDFLGIYDFLAWNDTEIIAVQTTTKTNRSSRRKKMLASHNFARWTQGNKRSVLLTWHKERGKWVATEENLTLADWQAFQGRQPEIDTESELYRMLFPDGSAIPTQPAEAQPRMPA